MATVQFADSETGGEAWVSVDRGMNCFRWRAPVNGRFEEIIWSEPDFESGTGRPSGSGVPVLFPFPGRIAGGRFEYGNRRFELGEQDGRGNAIHGFVYDRPWRITGQSSSSVTASFRASTDLPDWQSCWPSDFEIELSYEIAPGSLRAKFDVRNPGITTLPCALGLHPYFRVNADDERSEIIVPVREHYQLEDLIPTGTASPMDEPLRASLAGNQWDDVYGGVEFDHGRAIAEVFDGERGWKVQMSWSTDFPYCVVYTPPHRQAVCIEPYSALPNAIQLREHHVQTGLWEIEPGESKHVQIDWQVSAV